jgi:hypothetical protein
MHPNLCFLDTYFLKFSVLKIVFIFQILGFCSDKYLVKDYNEILLSNHMLFSSYIFFVQNILMDPKLNYDHPKYRDLLGFNNVGFRLENAGLVCFSSLKNISYYFQSPYFFVVLILYFFKYEFRYTYHVQLTSNGY